jgi:hypothetical protein
MDLRGIVGEASILDPSCEDCFHFGGWAAPWFHF